MVMCRYIDKTAATEAVLRDYNNMEYIIENTDSKIAEKIDKMYSRGSVVLDGMPKAHNQSSFEDNIIRCIDDVKVLSDRYNQAREYMEWFMPAWETLDARERKILEICYMQKHPYMSVADVLANELNVGKTQVYLYKKYAVEHLKVLLFGA